MITHDDHAALILCLLKGYYCHSSRSYAPKWSFQFEPHKWIIRLCLIEKSMNANEDVLMQFLRKIIDIKQFLNKDIVFIANIIINTDVNDPIIEISDIEEFELLNKNKIITDVIDSKCFQNYLKNNCHDNNNHNNNCHNNNNQPSNEPIVYANNHNIYVAKSLIPNAGLGLFANKDFHRNDTLLTFKGKKMKFNDFCKKYPESITCKHHEYALTAETCDGVKYVFDPIENETFDLYKNAIKNQNFGPLINEPSENQISNCETVSYHNHNIPLRVDIVVTRFIAKNEEILLLYNRDAEFYKPGSAPQAPLTISFQPMKQKEQSYLYCTNMHWDNNSDYYKLSQWKSKFEKVFIIAKEETKSEKEESFLQTNDEILTSLKNKKIKHILYANSNLDDVTLKLFQKGFHELILPFDAKLVYDFFFLNPTRQNEIAYELQFSLDFFWGVDFPCFKYQKSEKKTFFLRFRDVWTEKRIIEDKSVSDAKTVEWLTSYGAIVRKTYRSINIPLSKTQSYEFIQSLRI